MIYQGIELPDEYQGRNGLRVFKEEPEDRVVDDDVTLKTHAEAVVRQREVFLEEGIFRNNYFFLKFALLDKYRAEIQPARAEWQKVRATLKGQDWANRFKHPAFLKLKEIRAPYVNAMQVNRERWIQYKAEYQAEMDEISDRLEELWEKEEAERKKAEEKKRKKAEEKRRKKAEAEAAKRAASPHYDAHVRKGEENRRRAVAESEQRRRDWIATLQQMTDEEYRSEVVSEYLEDAKHQLGLSGLRLRSYEQQLMDERRSSMERWRKSGKPLGEWA